MSILSYSDPIAFFEAWFKEAKLHENNEPTTFCLATADSNGRVSARMVLLKDFSNEGFIFYTNYLSRKCSVIKNNSKVAACFHWKSIRKQIRIEGVASKISERDSDEYFFTRSRLSRIGARVSKQSQKLVGGIDKLMERFEEERKVFEGKEIPRPRNWGGIIIVPSTIEFWQHGEDRLHRRIIYTKVRENIWSSEELYP